MRQADRLSSWNMDGIYDIEGDIHPSLWGKPEYDPLTNKSWVEEFDITDRDSRVKALDLDSKEKIPGQEFRVFKDGSANAPLGAQQSTKSVYRSPNLFASPQIATFGHLPTADELWEAVGETYGGGAYLVYSLKPRMLIKRYFFNAPSKSPIHDDTPEYAKKKTEAGVGDSIAQEAIKAAFESLREDPKALAQFGAALIAKELKIAVPKRSDPTPQQSLEERLLEEEIANNPEMRRKAIDRALEKRYGRTKEKEEKAPPTLEEEIKRYKALSKLLGIDEDRKGGKEENSAIWKEVLLELVKNEQFPEIVKGILGTFNRQGSQGATEGVERRGLIEGQKGLQAPAVPPSRQIIEGQLVGVGEPKTAVEVESAPIQTHVQSSGSPQESEPQQLQTLQGGINLPKDTNWMQLISKVDFGVLEQGVDEDPREFVQELYRMVLEEQDEAAVAVIGLVSQDPPGVMHKSIKEVLGPSLKGQWQIPAKLMLGAKEYERVVRIVDKLSSDKGLEWLTMAYGSCMVFNKRIEEAAKEKSKEVDKTVEPVMIVGDVRAVEVGDVDNDEVGAGTSIL